MVAQREPQRMTVDEWRKLERISHDIKHEYIDGRAYVMPGGSLAHGRIRPNVCLCLYRACPTIQEYVIVATKYQAKSSI